MKTSIESYSSVPLINSGSVSEFGKGGLHRFSESMVDIRKKGLHLFCTCKHSLFSQNRVDPKKLDSEELMRFLILARFHGRMLCKKPSLHLCCKDSPSVGGLLCASSRSSRLPWVLASASPGKGWCLQAL